MLGLIHVPGVVELMLRSDVAHFVIHGILLITGLMMWWPVISPLPELPQLSPFMKMGYLFLQSLVPTIPASFLTLGDNPLYTIYETLPRVWGLSAHSDHEARRRIPPVGLHRLGLLQLVERRAAIRGGGSGNRRRPDLAARTRQPSTTPS